MTCAFWRQNIQSTSLEVLHPFYILDPILKSDATPLYILDSVLWSDQEYKMGGALPVKYSEYFGAKRRKSLKNENIRYDKYVSQGVY